MAPTGTVSTPSHDEQLMGPRGYATYHTRALCSHAGSGNYDCRGSGQFGYLGGNYLNYPNKGITSGGAYEMTLLMEDHLVVKVFLLVDLLSKFK